MFHKRQNVDAAVAFYVELLALEKLEKIILRFGNRVEFNQRLCHSRQNPDDVIFSS